VKPLLIAATPCVMWSGGASWVARSAFANGIK